MQNGSSIADRSLLDRRAYRRRGDRKESQHQNRKHGPEPIFWQITAVRRWTTMATAAIFRSVATARIAGDHTAPRGDKKLAAGRTCYVNLGQGVTVVWKALQRGIYPEIAGHAAIAKLGAGRMVRIGTYGDGAAVPDYIWDSLCADAAGHTAYTHQNGIVDVDASRYMISADSLADAQAQWIKGNRTFRVVPNLAAVDRKREAVCPASEEAGRKATCATCKLCGGNGIKAKSIAIVAHGATAGQTQGCRVMRMQIEFNPRAITNPWLVRDSARGGRIVGRYEKQRDAETHARRWRAVEPAPPACDLLAEFGARVAADRKAGARLND